MASSLSNVDFLLFHIFNRCSSLEAAKRYFPSLYLNARHGKVVRGRIFTASDIRTAEDKAVEHFKQKAMDSARPFGPTASSCSTASASTNAGSSNGGAPVAARPLAPTATASGAKPQQQLGVTQVSASQLFPAGSVAPPHTTSAHLLSPPQRQPPTLQQHTEPMRKPTDPQYRQVANPPQRAPATRTTHPAQSYRQLTTPLPEFAAPQAVRAQQVPLPASSLPRHAAPPYQVLATPGRELPPQREAATQPTAHSTFPRQEAPHPGTAAPLPNGAAQRHNAPTPLAELAQQPSSPQQQPAHRLHPQAYEGSAQPHPSQSTFRHLGIQERINATLSGSPPASGDAPSATSSSSSVTPQPNRRQLISRARRVAISLKVSAPRRLPGRPAAKAQAALPATEQPVEPVGQAIPSTQARPTQVTDESLWPPGIAPQAIDEVTRPILIDAYMRFGAATMEASQDIREVETRMSSNCLSSDMAQLTDLLHGLKEEKKNWASQWIEALAQNNIKLEHQAEPPSVPNLVTTPASSGSTGGTTSTPRLKPKSAAIGLHGSKLVMKKSRKKRTKKTLNSPHSVTEKATPASSKAGKSGKVISPKSEKLLPSTSKSTIKKRSAMRKRTKTAVRKSAMRRGRRS